MESNFDGVDAVLFLLTIVFFLFLIAIGDWLSERERKKAIARGELRSISHAEYNRMFGIKNELRAVDAMRKEA